jgi:hypothetical protein
MPDTGSNILITTHDNTASIATDYGSSGTGFTAAHVQIFKVAYGTDSTTTRVGTSAPLPVTIYGATGTTLPVSGTMSGSGNFNVVNPSGGFLQIAGTTFSTNPVGISGSIQGISGGLAVGITGTVTISNTGVGVFGISGATAIGITGGRRLNYSSDSITVYGDVGISGGLGLLAATDSIAVYGSDLGGKVLTRLYASDGTTLGYSGDALKVALTNSGITFSVTVAASVGITNDGTVGLMIRGTGNTASHPVIIQGTMASGAVEVAATTNLPVAVNNEVSIDDADIILSLESTSKPIVSNLTSIKTNTNIISTINDKLNNGTVQSKVTEIVRPTTVTSGRKEITTTPATLSSVTINTKVGVHIKCPTTNTATVFVGGRNILTAQNDGYPLDAGESIFIECDAVGKIFVRADRGTQIVNFIAS